LAADRNHASGPRRNPLETWEGWNALVVSQEATVSYWFMARADHARLKELVGAWASPDNRVGRLIVAKLDRALVSDPDQLPRDVVTLGSRIALKFRDDREQRVLIDPTRSAYFPGAMSVMSPLGALLLGMPEGKSLRAHDPDGSSPILSVEKVDQPDSLRASATTGEVAQRKLAS
jgi:hypothetical protein